MKFEFSRKDFEYHGVIFKRKEFSDFTLVELSFSPKLETSQHAHERANFCVILQGGSVEISGAKPREYSPLTTGFLPSSQAHSVRISNAGMKAFSIELAPKWLKRLSDFSLKADNPISCSGGILTQLLLRIYREYNEADTATPLVVEGLALEMLAEVTRHQTRIQKFLSPPWLKRLREILHENFAQNLSLSLLAREVDIHPSHLARTFRNHYQCSVGEYIRHLRLENAVEKLTAFDKSLTEIALEAGFYDYSHFSKFFKQFYGVSPSEFRFFGKERKAHT